MASTANGRKAITCVPKVAIAAPRRPSSGAPQLPKISIQFSTALTATAANIAHITIRVRSSAEK